MEAWLLYVMVVVLCILGIVAVRQPVLYIGWNNLSANDTAVLGRMRFSALFYLLGILRLCAVC